MNNTFVAFFDEMLAAGLSPQVASDVVAAGRQMASEIYSRRHAEFEGKERQDYFGTPEAKEETARIIESELVKIARHELALREVIQREVEKAQARGVERPRILVARLTL